MLSILGSSCIIWMLLQNNRKETREVLKLPLLLLLSIWCDVVNSVSYSFRYQYQRDTPGVWGAMGNYASCNAQGFLSSNWDCRELHNGALCFVFLRSVCVLVWKMTEMAKGTKNGYISSPFCGLWVPGAAWRQDLYSAGCWIAPEPLRCHRRDDVDCIRGENAYIYAWVPLWNSFDTSLFIYRVLDGELICK
jgi:hypothetical protein